MAAGKSDAPPQRRKVLRDMALGLALVLGLFAVLEGALRLTGFGRDTRTSPLAYQEVYPPAMVPARSAQGLEFWRTWDPRHPYQVLPLQKAPNALRVLCFGGSATAGLGHSPNVTFARQLEDLLAESYPSRTVEVINLGVVAIAAKQVRLLLEESLESLEPDLVLVWSGNNEFLPVHHQKYAAAHATWRSRLRSGLHSLNTYRAINRAVHGPPSPADVPDRNPSQDESERLTQARIIRDVSLEPGEFEAVLEAYGEELAGMLRAAQGAGVPLVLAGVAVNEEWRGREPLKDGWTRDFFAEPMDGAAAMGALDQRLLEPDLSTYDRWDLLTRLATLRDGAGQAAMATGIWRDALELDPHLRRATAAHRATAERVHAAAGGPQTAYFDAAEFFRADSPSGRVGFPQFYDYVHFTPRGAMLAADGLLSAAQGIAGFPQPEAPLRREASGLPTVFAERLRAIDGAEGDFLVRDEFLGLGLDKARLHSTDLWKYDIALSELDERLRQDPNDLRALVLRGCALSFRQNGQTKARADWEKALDLDPELSAAKANLASLPPLPAPQP